MNGSYWILTIPLVGLFAILRDGGWNWNVAPSNRLLTALFWIGWSSSIVVFALSLIQ